MASKAVKGKKVVNQEELRRLMREKKQSSERQKRVDSPHAKYTSLGHLSCAVCNVPVKSEILWQAHVLGKQHKDKVAELKVKKSPFETSQSSERSLLKRKGPEPELGTGKKAKAPSAGLPPGLVEEKGASAPAEHAAGPGLLLHEGEEGEQEAMDTTDNENRGGLGPTAGTSGLPADFFDSSSAAVAGASHSGSVSKADEERTAERKENTTEALPEGFFDDPVRDAKVRNVDTPKDQMDKEWEEFQKEMRQVNSASDAIVAEDDEEGRIERQIDEIDEQIECYRRVEVLRAKQDVVKGKVAKHKPEEVREASGSDEEDEEELLHVLSRDWRAKGALA
ncbi:hypothetical protein P4O66_000975 [Electrophorus voltai]|uniref:Zinc finger protein 830 n=1 Tax=Electrophorus voltai TaxID=2609070 RepID=A0AAD9DZF7_9TELE|nr:hypothetical protein P4O66_000975 [Electrophorus voltai]